MITLQQQTKKNKMSLTTSFDKLFDDFDLIWRPRWPSTQFMDEEFKRIRCDVKEDNDKFTVAAELPGMNKEDIKITFNNGALDIRGEFKREKEEKDEVRHVVERRYGKVSRRIGLPSNVDASQISAEYKDGVLYVNIPKTEKSKSVDVKIN